MVTSIISPRKIGQIVKFHTPLSDENPDQQYVIIELNADADVPRALVRALGTGLQFPPVNNVKIKDLTVVKISTKDLIGYPVTVITGSNEKHSGKAIKAQSDELLLELDLSDSGVSTNVSLTIVDDEEKEHVGFLVIENM